MNTITINDIRGFGPCYDPSRYLPENWQGTALDILAVQECPAVDRLWVVLREECVSSSTLRLFAVWCARQALALVTDPDPRSVAACDTAERFANSEATAEELAAAWAAAWAAAQELAAARAAAGATAGATAEELGAAWDAAWAAAEDAGAATRAVALDAQIEHLREMLTT